MLHIFIFNNLKNLQEILHYVQYNQCTTYPSLLVSTIPASKLTESGL